MLDLTEAQWELLRRAIAKRVKMMEGKHLLVPKEGPAIFWVTPDKEQE